jgi:hypothetical protein
MNAAEILKILYDYIGEGVSAPAFFDEVFGNSIGNDQTKEKILDLSDRQKRNLINGDEGFGHFASVAVNAFDPCLMSNWLDGKCTDNVSVYLRDQFSKHCPNITTENFSSEISDLLMSEIKEEALRYRKQKAEDDVELRAALFEENHGICPVPGCGCRLSLTSKTQGELRQMTAIRIDEGKPADFANCLGVCSVCAKKYLNSTDMLLHHSFANVKENLVNRAKAESSLTDIDMDEAMRRAVKKLKTIDRDEMTRLNYQALKIDQKIPPSNKALSEKIKSNVSLYFNSLQNLFRENDGEEGYSYALLSLSVRRAFNSLDKATKDQNVVFDLLTEKIMNLIQEDRSVCEIIVSYFVQSCEVFNEIPEQN